MCSKNNNMRRGVPELLAGLALIFILGIAAWAQSVAVQHTTVTDWGSGFQGEIRITNSGTQPINGWTLAFDFGGNINSIFNAEMVSRVGNRYTVRNADFNSTIPASGNVTFGFTATPGGITASTAPSNFSFNGTSNAGSQTITLTTFTYQGRLTDGASAANGTYDLQFALYDEAGGQIGTTQLRNDITVASGTFTVLLDFGGAAFTGANRVLEIRVRAGNSTGSYTTLTPRQPITSAPQAIRSYSAANADAATTALNATNVSGGFVQLPLTNGTPPAAECNAASQYGRQKVDATNVRLYICTAAGWKTFAPQ